MHRWAWGSGRRRTVKREERNKLQQAEGAGSDRGSTQPRVGASQSWFCSHLGVSRHARDPTTRHLGDSSGYGFPAACRRGKGPRRDYKQSPSRRAESTLSLTSPPQDVKCPFSPHGSRPPSPWSRPRLPVPELLASGPLRGGMAHAGQVHPQSTPQKACRLGPPDWSPPSEKAGLTRTQP